MQITFERTGGFAGMIVKTTINSNTLSDDAIKHLTRLIQACDFFDLPTEMRASPQPDRFQYYITIQDGKNSHTVIVSESTMPGTLRPLIEWLIDTARRKQP
ncbi:MAG: protealysin inhibitor emfourin [Leptolyngbyaceae cyanobacterium]